MPVALGLGIGLNLGGRLPAEDEASLLGSESQGFSLDFLSNTFAVRV